MDTDKSLEEAKRWVEANDFNILSNDVEERKIIFGIGDTELSFYIIEPQPSGNSAWMIWSDSENVLAHLNDVQDLSSSKTLSEVLHAVKKSLCPMLSKSTIDDDKVDENEDDDSDDDGDFDNYYGEEEIQEESNTEKQKPESEDEDLEENFFVGGGNPAAIQRLAKDFKNFKKDAEKFGISGGPRGDNLFVWDIQLKDIPESKLARDLKQYANKHNTEPFINIEMMFPSDYPMSPPFVRVITPRFKFLTGHITIGGSICMEMLTKSGWRPTNDIEAILVQIRCEILSDPNAQLDLNNANSAYTVAEAKDAFNRMVHRYGWDK